MKAQNDGDRESAQIHEIERELITMRERRRKRDSAQIVLNPGFLEKDGVETLIMGIQIENSIQHCFD